MKKCLFRIFTLVLVLSIAFGIFTSANGQPAIPNTIFLPSIRALPARSIFGVELGALSGLPVAIDAGVYWVRVNGLLWSDIQPNSPADWVWSNASDLDSSLVQNNSAGAQSVLVVRSSPSWAWLYYGYHCGPMAPSKIADFANFMKEAVKRYSAPPFGVNYYEIWNEPDVDKSQALGDSPFGCWGNFNDPYFGGGYYADMLKQVYPAIKAANPNAQVLIGGLLLDCDPNAGCAAVGHDAKPSKFFEGILKNNGGAYFDMANFHGYAHYNSTTSPIVKETTNYPNWPDGGVVQGKVNLLRALMATYGVNKPIFQTEAALVYDAPTPTPEYEQAKADYVVWVYTRNMTEGLVGTIWFRFYYGWRNSTLVDVALVPLPGYYALQFTSRELARSIYKGPVTTPAGLKGFAFTRDAKEVWALFSMDGNTHDFVLPAGFLAAYDEFGNPLTPVAGAVSVTHPGLGRNNPIKTRFFRDDFYILGQ